ncbi:hypothetical protein [Alkalicoccobacillus plakortidis]|uniref:Uncharacterized protein n=1 Tax=Alkalicoccobacillus plakortidis TaxID=444060 RepID=A0ABT0XLU1_9BACI|nr:hypothetical protein [Alkalicoccobacillus plakortidis]MCM2676871.1 hypothetical protein [Alkalicoccobacillus plakortidis]
MFIINLFKEMTLDLFAMGKGFVYGFVMVGGFILVVGLLVYAVLMII